MTTRIAPYGAAEKTGTVVSTLAVVVVLLLVDFLLMASSFLQAWLALIPILREEPMFSSTRWRHGCRAPREVVGTVHLPPCSARSTGLPRWEWGDVGLNTAGRRSPALDRFHVA